MRQGLLIQSTLVLALSAVASAAQAQAGVANCAKAKPGLEQLLCKDEALMALDKRMAEVLSAAEPIAAKERPPMLKAEQRGWTKGRDDCLKAADPKACLTPSYKRRIAELQANYRLLPPTVTANYQCGSKPEDMVKTLSFDTDPPSMWAEFDENTSVLFRADSALGRAYVSDQVNFLDVDGTAKVVWGPGSAPMSCSKQ